MDNGYNNDQVLFYEVEKMRTGNFDDYQSFYNLSRNFIYKIIYDIVGEPNITEQIIVSTYNKIYEGITALTDVNSFYSWAGRIASSEALVYIKTAYGDNLFLDVDEDDSDFIFDRLTEDNQQFLTEDILSDIEKQRIIQATIDSLAPMEKLIVQCYFYESYSVTEIAAMLNVSKGKVKAVLGKVKKQLMNVCTVEGSNNGVKLYALSQVPILWFVFKQAIDVLSVTGIAGAGAVGAGTVGGMGVAGAGSAGLSGSAGVAGAGSTGVMGSAVGGSGAAGTVGAVADMSGVAGSAGTAGAAGAAGSGSVALGGGGAATMAAGTAGAAGATAAGVGIAATLAKIAIGAAVIGAGGATVYHVTHKDTMTATEKAYYSYVNEEVAPEKGVADIEDKTHTCSYADGEAWLGTTGVVSAQISDLDDDGNEEMLLISYENGGRGATNLNAQVYTYDDEKEDAKPVLEDEEKLSFYSNSAYFGPIDLTLFNDEYSVDNLYITEIDAPQGKYIVVENSGYYPYGDFAQGLSWFDVSVYQYSNKDLKLIASETGTNVNNCFELRGYTLDDGRETANQLLFSYIHTSAEDELAMYSTDEFKNAVNSFFINNGINLEYTSFGSRIASGDEIYDFNISADNTYVKDDIPYADLSFKSTDHTKLRKHIDDIKAASVTDSPSGGDVGKNLETSAYIEFVEYLVEEQGEFLGVIDFREKSENHGSADEDGIPEQDMSAKPYPSNRSQAGVASAIETDVDGDGQLELLVAFVQKGESCRYLEIHLYKDENDEIIDKGSVSFSNIPITANTYMDVFVKNSNLYVNLGVLESEADGGYHTSYSYIYKMDDCEIYTYRDYVFNMTDVQSDTPYYSMYEGNYYEEYFCGSESYNIAEIRSEASQDIIDYAGEDIVSGIIFNNPNDGIYDYDYSGVQRMLYMESTAHSAYEYVEQLIIELY